jgi:hypothetical protein
MLKKTQRQKHLVVTGVAICRGDEIASDVEVTEVEFRNTSEEALVRTQSWAKGMTRRALMPFRGRSAPRALHKGMLFITW